MTEAEGKVNKMLEKYASIQGVLRTIREGVKLYSRFEKERVESSGDGSVLHNAIVEIKVEYCKLRIEGFHLRKVLLGVMSAAEIHEACLEYKARSLEWQKRRKSR